MSDSTSAAETILISCQQCHARYRVPMHWAGRNVACQKCHCDIIVFALEGDLHLQEPVPKSPAPTQATDSPVFLDTKRMSRKTTNPGGGVPWHVRLELMRNRWHNVWATRRPLVIGILAAIAIGGIAWLLFPESHGASIREDGQTARSSSHEQPRDSQHSRSQPEPEPQPQPQAEGKSQQQSAGGTIPSRREEFTPECMVDLLNETGLQNVLTVRGGTFVPGAYIALPGDDEDVYRPHARITPLIDSHVAWMVAPSLPYEFSCDILVKGRCHINLAMPAGDGQGAVLSNSGSEYPARFTVTARIELGQSPQMLIDGKKPSSEWSFNQIRRQTTWNAWVGGEYGLSPYMARSDSSPTSFGDGISLYVNGEMVQVTNARVLLPKSGKCGLLPSQMTYFGDQLPTQPISSTDYKAVFKPRTEALPPQSLFDETMNTGDIGRQQLAIDIAAFVQHRVPLISQEAADFAGRLMWLARRIDPESPYVADVNAQLYAGGQITVLAPKCRPLHKVIYGRMDGGMPDAAGDINHPALLRLIGWIRSLVTRTCPSIVQGVPRYDRLAIYPTWNRMFEDHGGDLDLDRDSLHGAWAHANSFARRVIRSGKSTTEMRVMSEEEMGRIVGRTGLAVWSKDDPAGPQKQIAFCNLSVTDEAGAYLLIWRAPLVGDFQAAMEVYGRGSVGVMPVNGADPSITAEIQMTCAYDGAYRGQMQHLVYGDAAGVPEAFTTLFDPTRPLSKPAPANIPSTRLYVERRGSAVSWRAMNGTPLRGTATTSEPLCFFVRPVAPPDNTTEPPCLDITRLHIRSLELTPELALIPQGKASSNAPRSKGFGWLGEVGGVSVGHARRELRPMPNHFAPVAGLQGIEWLKIAAMSPSGEWRQWCIPKSILVEEEYRERYSVLMLDRAILPRGATPTVNITGTWVNESSPTSLKFATAAVDDPSFPGPFKRSDAPSHIGPFRGDLGLPMPVTGKGGTMPATRPDCQAAGMLPGLTLRPNAIHPGRYAIFVHAASDGNSQPVQRGVPEILSVESSSETQDELILGLSAHLRDHNDDGMADARDISVYTVYRAIRKDAWEPQLSSHLDWK